MVNILGHTVSPAAVLSVVGFAFGGLAEYLFAKYRRFRRWQDILKRVRLEKIRYITLFTIRIPGVEEQEDGSHLLLGVRDLGAITLEEAIPNEYARDLLLKVVKRKQNGHQSVVDMQGQEGGLFLLDAYEELCELAGVHGSHALGYWYMTLVVDQHQAFTFKQPSVILARPEDLKRFLDFKTCRGIKVNRGSDGGKILLMMEIAKSLDDQRKRMLAAVADGVSRKFKETGWLVQIRVDSEYLLPTQAQIADGTLKAPQKVEWDRYEEMAGLILAEKLEAIRFLE